MNLPFYIKITQFYVILTFIIALVCLDHKKANHKYLLYILIVCSSTEIVSSILIYFHKSISTFSSVCIIIHDYLWLIFLIKNSILKKARVGVLLAFLSISIINLLYIEGLVNFNYFTFILGAFLYIVIFLYESFYQLKKENLSFFLTNSYLLFFSPILFFFGLSFAFAFQSKLLLYNSIVGKISLYDFIIYFVNIIYYTLINIYIYREKRLRNAG